MGAAEGAARAKANELVRSLFSVPLRFVILHLTALHGEVHGYEVMKRVEELTLGYWRPSTSTIYMVLDNMVKEGLLERRLEYKGKVKRIKYRVTEKGLEVLRISLDTIAKILYHIMACVEELRNKLREIKLGEKILDKDDLIKQISLLEKIKDIIEERITTLQRLLKEMEQGTVEGASKH